MLRRYARSRALTRGLAVVLLALASFAGRPAAAQTFTKITDASNPIVTDPVSPANSFVGASWIDYNDDGLDDLFVNRRSLYKNLGGGAFTRVFLTGQGNSIGSSWADIDNDGDVDAFTTGQGAGGFSYLWVNNGDDTFTRRAAGFIGDSLSNQGWGCAWGDYDQDGFVDLALVQYNTAANLNHLFHNNHDGTFTSIASTDLTVGVAAYTAPTWSDFDLDGDLDLFVGCGPADGTIAPDRLYRNTRVEGGPSPLVFLTTAPLATDSRDGQVWNWIDVDNDGDLDAYITNYGGGFSPGIVNDLYRNEGGSTYTRLTPAQAGDIVLDVDHSLASVWEDFDNDGDLDCVVSNDGPFPARYYRNNGDGTFTRLSLAPLSTVNGPHYGAAAADWDNDGDVDLFLTGTTGTGRMLLRNDTPAGNHWIALRLRGTLSNRSAIGATIRLRAAIGGQPVWQRREISAQNTWVGQNSLVAHFGLGDATAVDSIEIRWPAGGLQRVEGLAVDARHDVVEPATTSVAVPVLRVPDDGLALLGARPHPSRGRLTIAFRLPAPGPARLELFDLAGRLLRAREVGGMGAGTHVVDLEERPGLGPGLYLVRLTREGRSLTTRVAVVR